MGKVKILITDDKNSFYRFSWEFVSYKQILEIYYEMQMSDDY